ARDSNLIGAAGLEGLDCQNHGRGSLYALSFRSLARTHAAVMEACRSCWRRKRRAGIQGTGHTLHVCGQGCNERPPCSLRVYPLHIPHSCGLILTMPVTVGLEIVRMWSRSLPSKGV